jgi:hypothetical protein
LLMGNNNPIDMALDSLRRTIAYKESLAYLKSDDQQNSLYSQLAYYYFVSK